MLRKCDRICFSFELVCGKDCSTQVVIRDTWLIRDFSLGVVFVKLRRADVVGAQNFQVRGYYDHASFHYPEQLTSTFLDRQVGFPEQLIEIPEQLIRVPKKLILGTRSRVEQVVPSKHR
ncbi:hypothetical protein U1Q18_029571 [Sarracenia purpurea var. burkii]